MKTSITDYVTEFGTNDGPIAFVNNRNMINIEELKAKGEEENWEEKFKTHKGSWNY